MLTLGDVEIEEVAVEDGLHTSGHDGDQIKEALRVVAVDPVEDVQSPVQAHCKKIKTLVIALVARLEVVNTLKH